LPLPLYENEPKGESLVFEIKLDSVERNDKKVVYLDQLPSFVRLEETVSEEKDEVVTSIVLEGGTPDEVGTYSFVI